MRFEKRVMPAKEEITVLSNLLNMLTFLYNHLPNNDSRVLVRKLTVRTEEAHTSERKVIQGIHYITLLELHC
jgi:uncharacterized protein YpbB